MVLKILSKKDPMHSKREEIL